MTSKKGLFFAAVLLLSLLLVLGHAASPISISVENVKPTVIAGDYAEYNAVVLNDGAAPMAVVFAVSGPKADAWVQAYNYSITVQPGAVVKVPIKIHPLADAAGGTYAYSILVQTKAGGGDWEPLESTATILLTVVQSSTNFADLARIYLSFADDRTTYYPSESVVAQAQIYALKQVFPELQVTIQLLDSDGRPVYSSMTALTSQREPIKPVIQTIPLNIQTSPGDYYVVAELSSDTGAIAKSQKAITVGTVRKVDERRAVSKGLLSRRIAIYAENSGNVIVGGTLVESIAWYEKFLMSASPAPNIIPASGGKLNLVWTYDVLKPGERTQSFSYSVSYLPLILGAILAGLVAFLAWQRIKLVSIGKEVIKQRIAQDVLEATLTLHVKNNTDKEMKSVIVTDYVPNLAKAVEFGTAKPKETRSDKLETALIWDLGELKGGEERVITYKLRTTVGVLGSIDLPAANVNFKDLAGKPGFVRSNTAECGRNV